MSIPTPEKKPTFRRDGEDATICSPAKRLKSNVEPESNLREQRDAERRAEKERNEAERKAEKELKEQVRKAEKERKEQVRLAEKERKEAEHKAVKERKEREKEAERERKEREKEAEKERKEREKEAEKERKEREKAAEKERKEAEKLRQQPRINLFFKKSQQPQSQPDTSSQLSQSVASQESSTLSTHRQVAEPQPDGSSADYKKHILPFHVKLEGQLFNGVCNYFPSTAEEHTMDPLVWLNQQQQRQQSDKPKTKLTSQEFQQRLALAHESSQVSSLLSQIRIRRLQFSHLSNRHIEDNAAAINAEYRPPYVGSIKDISLEAKRHLAMNPFRTDLDDSLAYEYDSEAEWDLQEEGEDLRDEDGSDSDDSMEDGEELREFLTSDDEESTSKRPRILGLLTPVLIWGEPSLHQYNIELLIPESCIDPFAKYEESVVSGGGGNDVGSDNSNNTVGDIPDTVESVLASLVSKLDVEALKSAIVSHNGSTATKTLIVELLKQQFPGATDKEVRLVFDKCMERVGKKRTEKRWVLTAAFTGTHSVPQPTD